MARLSPLWHKFGRKNFFLQISPLQDVRHLENDKNTEYNLTQIRVAKMFCSKIIIVIDIVSYHHVQYQQNLMIQS